MDYYWKDRISEIWLSNMLEQCSMQMKKRRYSFIHPNILEDMWNSLSANPTVTFNTMKKHFDKPWNMKFVSKNPSVTWEIVKDNPQLDWDGEGFSENPNITLDIVKNNPQYKWNWRLLSKNMRLTIDDVRNNITLPWNFFYLVQNPSFTFTDVINSRDISWNLNFLHYNPNITTDIFDNNPKIFSDNANFYFYNQNKSITNEYYLNNPNKPWDLHYLINNPNIQWSDKQFGSQNTRITWKIIGNDTIFVRTYASNPMNFKQSDKINLMKRIIRNRISKRIHTRKTS